MRDLVLQLVDDRVQPDLHAFLLGQFGGLALRPNVEADDDRVRRRCQQDVALGDRADAGVDDLDAHLLGRHLLQRIGQHFTEPVTSPLRMSGRSFTPACLICSARPSSETRETLRQLRLALLHLAVLRNALGLVAVRDDEERVARIRHAFETEDLDRRRWAGLVDRASAIVEHRADLAEGIARR